MSSDDNKNELQNEDEALEFLIQRNQDRKQKQHFQELFDKAEVIRPNVKVISLRSKITRIAGVAAIIIIGFVFGFKYLDGDLNVSSFAAKMSQETQFEISENVRGEVDNGSNIDQQITEALRQGNFEEVIKLYELKSDPLSDRDSFYLAASLFKSQSNDYDKIQVLTSRSIQTKDQYYTESLWMSAITYIMSEDYDQAKTQLEALLPYPYQNQNVKVLISLIEKR